MKPRCDICGRTAKQSGGTIEPVQVGSRRVDMCVKCRPEKVNAGVSTGKIQQRPQPFVISLLVEERIRFGGEGVNPPRVRRFVQSACPSSYLIAIRLGALDQKENGRTASRLQGFD
jgi:hypothetical protein